jgi:hypothetical protein
MIQQFPHKQVASYTVLTIENSGADRCVVVCRHFAHRNSYISKIRIAYSIPLPLPTMKVPVSITILLYFLHATVAFIAAPQFHWTAVRPTRQVAHLKFPRVPFLQGAAEERTSTITDDAVGTDSTTSVEFSPVNATVMTMGQQSVKELSETEKLLKQVKEAGLAGVISYALWELAFWAVSVPVVLFGYYEVTGHWPDLSDSSDVAKLSAEAFAFVNFARFAVPLRIGLALSTTSWIQANVVDRFTKKDDSDVSTPNGTTD